MPDSSTLAVFCLAALALLVVPGPSVLYVVTRSMDQGRTAGIVSVLGIHVGSLVHVAAAALGLSALLMSSALAFNTVKYAGAVYLIVLGVRRLMTTESPAGSNGRDPSSLARIFGQGVVVNVLNPKTALFFFAFLPQFVDVARGPVGPQIVLLGCVFIALGILSDGLYAMVAATLGSWLRSSAAYLWAERWVSGGVLVGLGVTAAVAHSGTSKK